MVMHSTYKLPPENSFLVDRKAGAKLCMFWIQSSDKHLDLLCLKFNCAKNATHLNISRTELIIMSCIPFPPIVVLWAAVIVLNRP